MIALLAGSALGAVVLLFVVIFVVAAVGGGVPAERAVQSFHAAAKDGDCDEMMQLIELPPDDELPRPKDKLATLLCDNAEENIENIPDSIDTDVLDESDNAAKVKAYGAVDDREWSETYKLSKTDGDWRIRWGSETS